MQELMSRHKAYALSPRDCLKTTLFQKWQRMVAPPGNSVVILLCIKDKFVCLNHVSLVCIDDLWLWIVQRRQDLSQNEESEKDLPPIPLEIQPLVTLLQ